MQKKTSLTKLLEIGFYHVGAKCAVIAAQINLQSILSEEPMSIDELAGRLNFKVEAVQKLIWVLDAQGLVKLENNQVSASDLTSHLDYFLGIHLVDGYQVIDDLLYTLQTGKSCWEKHYGCSFYEFLKKNPNKSEAFSRWCQITAKTWMSEISRLYDFSPYNTIVDLGGGNGNFLSSILQNHKNANGILFELPLVIEHAKQILSESDRNRIKLMSGDFFKEVPKGGDLYIICRSLLNWSDSDAIQILNNCFDAMSTNGRLLILDFVLPEKGHLAYFGATMSNMSLYAINMGTNRTHKQWHDLVKQTKFKTNFVYQCNDDDFLHDPNLLMPICVIEAVKRL